MHCSWLSDNSTFGTPWLDLFAPAFTERRHSPNITLTAVMGKKEFTKVPRSARLW